MMRRWWPRKWLCSGSGFAVPLALPQALAKQTAVPGWPEEQWRQQFNSPDLDRIMEVALNENPELRKAYARLGEADAVAQVEGARLLPWLDSDNTFRQLRCAKHGVVASYNPELGGTVKPRTP
jgi:outer membrane protein TolC